MLFYVTADIHLCIKAISRKTLNVILLK